MAIAAYGEHLRLAPSLPLAVIVLGLAIPALVRGSPVTAAFAGYVVLQHIVGWTFPDNRAFFQVSTIIAVVALLAFVSSRSAQAVAPIWREPTFYMGIAPLIPSVVIALALGQFGSTLARLGQGAVLLGFLASARRIDPVKALWGLSGGIHIGLAVLLLADATTPLTDGRLAGGTWAHTHPNVIAMLAWPTAIIWMTLRGSPTSQRWLGATSMVTIVLLTNSRTSAAALVVAIAATAGVRGGGIGQHAGGRFKMIDAAIIGIVVIGVATAVGQSYFPQARVPGGDVLSGRASIWRQAASDFRAASIMEKLLGTREGGANARVTVDEGGTPTVFVAHNAVLGLVRKSGLVGLGLGIAGLIALLRLGIRVAGNRTVAAVAIIVGSLATIPFEAFIFGGTLWIWLVVSSQMFSRERDPST